MTAADDVVVGSVLFTDLVGFTEYTDELGDRAAVDVLEQQRRLVEGVLRGHPGGRLVKELGDGLMIWFGSEVDGVEAAREALAAFGRARRVDGFPLAVRMGLHRGEAIGRGDDFVGQTVNVAARVAELAGPGELVASVAALDASWQSAPADRGHRSGDDQGGQRADLAVSGVLTTGRPRRGPRCVQSGGRVIAVVYRFVEPMSPAVIVSSIESSPSVSGTVISTLPTLTTSSAGTGPPNRHRCSPPPSAPTASTTAKSIASRRSLTTWTSSAALAGVDPVGRLVGDDEHRRARRLDRVVRVLRHALVVEDARRDQRRRVGQRVEAEPAGRSVLQPAQRLDLHLEHVRLVVLRVVPPRLEVG